MSRLRPCATVASVIDVDVVDGAPRIEAGDEPDEYAPIREAWDGRTLDASTPGLRAAIGALSNECDYLSMERAMDSDERRFYRRASDALTRMLDRVKSCYGCDAGGLDGLIHTCGGQS